MNEHMPGNVSGNTVAWALLGGPAILGWVAFGVAWLLAPRLGGEVVPLMWAFWAVAGWYGFLALVFGGAWGLVMLAAMS